MDWALQAQFVFTLMIGLVGYTVGVSVTRKKPLGQAWHVRSVAPEAMAVYCVPGGQVVLCVVQPVLDVLTVVS